MIVERKKKMKEIRKVMKEEEKLRQRDRETAATASCPPPQPLAVVPSVKEETHSPELSPPPQHRDTISRIETGSQMQGSSLAGGKTHV